MNSKGVFVIGTDTDIGKTYCSFLLQHALRKQGGSYYKPVQSGGFERGGRLIAPDVDFVCQREGLDYQEEMTSYVLKAEVSPHLASELEGKELSREKILADYAKLQEKYQGLIVEGAGGLLVPLIRGQYYIYDMIRDFGLPVVLVSSLRVGSINHAVLTLRALEELGLPLHGIVFNQVEDTEESRIYEEDNKALILEASPTKNHLVIRRGEEALKEEAFLEFWKGEAR